MTGLANSTIGSVPCEEDRRVLIVDDDRDFADGLADLLEFSGYRVRIANSGQVALEVAAEFGPGVALLDIRLGAESGLDLIESLSGERHGAVCLLMTAHADTGSAIEAVRRGAFDYLRKPLESARVLSVLEFCFANLRLEAEKRAAEEALRDSEMRYRSLVELLPDAVFVQRRGMLEFANSSAVELYGAAGAEDLVGRPAIDIVHPDDRALWANQVGGGAETDSRAAFVEERGRRLDGSTFHAEAASLPFSYRGEPATLTIVHDITARRSMEEQLRQAQKMEALGQLTGGVAHEFNNLLAIILGNLDLIRNELADDESVTDLAGHATGAVERGVELTQALLSYTKQLPLRPRAVDLNTFVPRICLLLRPMLGESIAIDTVLASEHCSAMVDPAQLETAILTLASNARDAMPAGGRLTVRTDRVGPGEVRDGEHVRIRGTHAILTFEDTGSGMSDEVLARCFDPFYSTKDVGKGTGLGLSMVDGFIRQSGGRIEIESAPGRGTTFAIHLPGAVGAEEEGEADASDAAVASGDGKTVLVVEDDTAVRESVVGLLRSLGYETVAAADAETTLRRLEETPDVALLFSDLVLPRGGSGADIARRARRRRPGLKVLFTTGHSDEAVARHGRLEDGADLIQKPYRKADLARKVAAALGA